MTVKVEVWELPVMPGVVPVLTETFATPEEARRFAAGVEAEGVGLLATVE